MQFRFRQFRLWVRDSLKKTGKALHTKTTSTTTTTVKLHHKEPEKLKRWHCCCFTTTSLHPEMHQTSFSCRDFGFFRRFFTPNTKRGLNKRITKTYCPKNTLHRKQQQLHFTLKESEKCIIIICGEEIYVKKESKKYSQNQGTTKCKKVHSQTAWWMHQGEEKRTKETSADEPLAVVLGVNALIIVTATGRDNIRRPMQQMQLRYRLRQRWSRCRCLVLPWNAVNCIPASLPQNAVRSNREQTELHRLLPLSVWVCSWWIR